MIYIHIYIYVFIYIFTFIHSVHDFAWFTLICYIRILHKNKKNYFKQILLITSVRVSKKNQFSKTSTTKNDNFLLMLWDSVVKFKCFPPNIHHFCFSNASHVMFPNKFRFCFAGSKKWYVCFHAKISCKLVFWRCSKPFQQINSLFHLKSSKSLTSALSAVTKAYCHLLGY